MVEELLEIIYRSIDDLAGMFPFGSLADRQPEAVLIGPGSSLDSLTIVNLLASIEAGIEEVFGREVPVIDVLFEDYQDMTVDKAAACLAAAMASDRHIEQV